MKETHGHKCIKCNKVFRNDIVFYNHKNIVCPDCQQNTGDLIQYVTNLLYFVHNEGRNMDNNFFDKWVEESTNDLSAYFAQSQPSDVSDEIKRLKDRGDMLKEQFRLASLKIVELSKQLAELEVLHYGEVQFPVKSGQIKPTIEGNNDKRGNTYEQG